MYCIRLFESMKLFGVKHGFSFWFRWNVTDPIRIFVWKHITHKPYCTYSGWFCKNPNCTYRHLTTKKEINQHQKELIEESKTIMQGDNGECAYCGEEPGTELIDDPNWDSLGKWNVCKSCKEIIKIQSDIAGLSLLPTKEADDKIFLLNNRLLEIEKETGKKVFSIGLQRGLDGYEVIDK